MEDNPQFFDLVGDVRAMRRLKPDPVRRRPAEESTYFDGWGTTAS